MLFMDAFAVENENLFLPHSHPVCSGSSAESNPLQ